MAGAFGKIFGKIFGNKADKDLKELTPFVGKINEEFEKLKNLSNDELRFKTEEFKGIIKASLSEITHTIDDTKARADDSELMLTIRKSFTRR